MRKIEVNLIRGQIVKSLMRPLSVVKSKPLSNAPSQLGAVIKRPQVKILILERPPQPLNENIVLNSATAIHADAHMMRLEQISKSAGDKLSPRVGIKDFWRSMAANGLYNRLDIKIAVQGY